MKKKSPLMRIGTRLIFKHSTNQQPQLMKKYTLSSVPITLSFPLTKRHMESFMNKKLVGSASSPAMMLPCTLGFLFLTFVLSTVASADDKPSAYEVLEQYDFPIGLLPKGVTGYDLDRATGQFKVYWGGTCSFSLENSYQLRYQSTITGVLSKDRLSNLQGVSVKVLFFWINIVEVVRRGDSLEFSVGILSADFSLDNFEERPQCGCGLACNNHFGSTVPTTPSYSLNTY